MPDFTDTPGANGPAPLGPDPQSGGPSPAPRFAPRPDEAAPADGAPPPRPPGPAAPQSSPQAPGQHPAPPSPPQAPGQHIASHRATVPDGAGNGAAPKGAAQADVKGRIHIADEVVEKVAALAAHEVEGVADLGGDLARAVESVRERIGIGNKRSDQGVKADVEGNEVYVTVTIMVEFGHVVLDVARRVQLNVASKTQRMLGLKVVEVNVTVDDVCTVRERDDEGAAEVVVTGG